MEKLANTQEELGKSIGRVVINLKKMGQAKITAGVIAARIDRLNQLWRDYEDNHLKLIAYTDAASRAHAYFTEDKYQATEESCILQLGELMDLKEQKTSDTQPDLSHETSTSNIPLSMLSQPPRLSLPKFSGSYSDWTNFRDLFNTMIIGRRDIPNVSKLQYLKTCLSGEPAQLLGNLAITDANFQIAWDLLVKRYDNKRLLVRTHVTAIFQIKSMNTESSVELRRVYNATVEALGALGALDVSTDNWDVLLVEMTLLRLDERSRRDWETARGNDIEISKFDDLKTFMEGRIRALETIEGASKSQLGSLNSKVSKGSDHNSARSGRTQTHSTTSNIFHASSSQSSSSRFDSNTRRCFLCKGPHYITTCSNFLAKSVKERRDLVIRLNLCFNCLSRHSVRDCRSERRCSVCKRKHNSMLHEEAISTASGNSISRSVPMVEASSASGNSANPIGVDPVATHMANCMAAGRKILLATVRVRVTGPHGNSILVRALLDQGSEVSFVSENVAQLLQLNRRKIHVPLIGIAASNSGMAKYMTQITITSLVDSGFSLPVEALILPKLTNTLPTTEISDFNATVLGKECLADPDYNRRLGVGMILGADVYGLILRDGLRTIPETSVVAQNTVFGWVLSGVVLPPSNSSPINSVPQLLSFHCSTNARLFQDLQRFWELEEVPNSSAALSADDEWCEKQFRDTHTRDSTGRYVVRLPVNPERPVAAEETRDIASASLRSLQRRLHRDAELAEKYHLFMSEYVGLGHMEKISYEKSMPHSAWYLPHHPVVQTSPMGRKFRVVFDASRRINGGLSLNDFLLSGPALQNDLSLILSDWRRHRFVFSADIVKMFRQILVHPEDCNLQRILWEESESGRVSDFRLITVTYGTTCAPYLAIRTLRQVAEDEGARFPFGAHAIKHESFVDDILSGADDLGTALEIRDQLIALLATGGFSLGKWSANDVILLQNLNRDSHTIHVSRAFDIHEVVKTLGIIWLPKEDVFGFHVPSDLLPEGGCSSKDISKRSILSSIARVFDPLGWISPVTVSAKIIIQDLWLLGVEWDASLPFHVKNRWLEYSRSLGDLRSIKIPRWIGYTPSTQQFQLHGFADASSRAYAASVYLRIPTEGGQYLVSLIASKSKVAPVKTVSVPRLELCSAVLLVKLLVHVRKSPSFSSAKVTGWLDSQVALCWLRKHPTNWTTFVANRVSFVQTTLAETLWKYVPTGENPADLATRGVSPSFLRSCDLWWHGPSWLAIDEERWLQQPEFSSETALEQRRSPATVMVIQETIDIESALVARFSSLSRLLRVTSYCLRFIKRCRNRDLSYPPFLSSVEVREAEIKLIQLVQGNSFQDEIRALKSHVALPRKTPIGGLNPFMDEDGVMRVGGRLHNANLNFREKHPPILPKDSHFSKLVVIYAHLTALHGGVSLTLGILLQRAWILGAKVLVKAHIRSCVTCYRNRPRLGNQLMGDLPAVRITPGRPFSKTGLDYAGPIQLRMSKGRALRSYKGYICLFICTVSKAIHLEVVSDCTTQAFVAAFRRFCGRRGVPTNLYSDNSTTFRGASAELRALFRASSDFYREIAELIANDGTSWSFIPPQAPHFGGLWEAGIKSVKFHLHRVIGEQILTFEELSTVLAQIEACLNSRPLCPMSSDPEDLTILTPGHFLVGSSLVGVPEPSLLEVRENHLSRWQMVQRMQQDFWRRWSQEYLHQLQQRFKWRDPQVNFAVGQLVLLKDDRYPPSKWALGRVIELHPGSDGHVRVVSVRTATSIFRRSIVKLSPLPINDGSDLVPHGGRGPLSS